MQVGSFPVQERDKRLALNEALFREINERVEERVAEQGSDDAKITVMCECADLDCTQRIELTVAEYESAHRDPTQFTVAPGHVAYDVEEVVLRTDRFAVVRKRGLAGEVAAALDG